MKGKKIASDVIRFLDIYINSITLSDNETANIEYYLRAKGIMDMVRFYHKKKLFTDKIFAEIETKFKEIENLTILRINNTF